MSAECGRPVWNAIIKKKKKKKFTWGFVFVLNFLFPFLYVYTFFSNCLCTHASGFIRLVLIYSVIYLFLVSSFSSSFIFPFPCTLPSVSSLISTSLLSPILPLHILLSPSSLNTPYLLPLNSPLFTFSPVSPLLISLHSPSSH